MSNYVELAEEIGDRYLAALAARQESFLRYVKATRSLAEQASFLPAMTVPLTTPQQINAAQFELASKVLEHQKQFFDRLFGQAPGGAMAGWSTSPPSRETGTIVPLKAPANGEKKTTSKTADEQQASAKTSPTRKRKTTSKKATSKRAPARDS